jgi:uncharacterized protein with PIN domain
MKCARFSFDASLRFFLPGSQDILTHSFDWRASIKDMIESLGVPHPEIETILVNEQPVDFSYIVADGDQIKVFGPDGNAPSPLLLRPPYAGRARFVLDTHLGRLAAYLRMMGFDTLYRNDYPDDELAEISHHDQRILLTRDVGLLKRSLVTYGYYVRTLKPKDRLAEITQRYQLVDDVAPFKHCMKCNGLLHPVDKAEVLDQLPDGTAQYYERFHQCDSCQRIFWKGAHYQRMQQLMDSVLNGKGR